MRRGTKLFIGSSSSSKYVLYFGGKKALLYYLHQPFSPSSWTEYIHTYIHNGKSHRGTPSDLWIVDGFFVRWNLKACGFFPWSRKLASSSSSQIANCNSLTGLSAEEGERRMRKRCFFISCLPPPLKHKGKKDPCRIKGWRGWYRRSC